MYKMPTPFFLKKKARVKNFAFCNTRSIKTTLSWYLYHGNLGRRARASERASEREEKCARNALRAHERKARKARTQFQTKLKFERGFVSDFRCVVLRARATLK